MWFWWWKQVDFFYFFIAKIKKIKKQTWTPGPNNIGLPIDVCEPISYTAQACHWRRRFVLGVTMNAFCGAQSSEATALSLSLQKPKPISQSSIFGLFCFRFTLMASIVANLHLPVLVHGRQPVLRTLGKFTVSATGGKLNPSSTNTVYLF